MVPAVYFMANLPFSDRKDIYEAVLCGVIRILNQKREGGGFIANKGLKDDVILNKDGFFILFKERWVRDEFFKSIHCTLPAYLIQNIKMSKKRLNKDPINSDFSIVKARRRLPPSDDYRV